MVRIIAGEFRSRTLLTLPDEEQTRPYLSRVKESVFGMLHEWFVGAHVLDLFAGVGTVGLEAVSRGAEAVLMVEKDARTYQVLVENIERLRCGDRARAMQGDALGGACLRAAPAPCSLVFVDPPYPMMEQRAKRGRILEQITRCRSIMPEKGFVILRSPRGPDDWNLEIAGFRGPEPHRYRQDMWVLLYEPGGPPGDGEAP